MKFTKQNLKTNYSPKWIFDRFPKLVTMLILTQHCLFLTLPGVDHHR